MKIKKWGLILLCLTFIFMLAACGNKAEKSLVEQIDEQLTGTWVSYDSDIVMSKWTFFDGKYVVGTGKSD